MRILAIETSCDETAIALIEASGGLRTPKFKILKNVVSSQTAVHAHWGGVVPNLAKREHIKNLPVILRKIFRISKSEFPPAKPRVHEEFGIISKQVPKSKIQNIDLVAVTVGPGLEPALWTGVNFAKEVHRQLTRNRKQGTKKRETIKLIGVNHLEGHLYSFLLDQKRANSKFSRRQNRRGSSTKSGQIPNSKIFPAIHLLVSGGHTILILMKSLTKWKKLGETRDDAVGEAYDKVARMLHLPYPGGPEIERLAAKGNPNAIQFPRPMINSKDFEFSFSGLKTSVLYWLRDHKQETKKQRTKNDVAASFQQAAIDVLVSKTIRAAKKFDAKSIMLSGGVASNKALRKALQTTAYKLQTNFFAAPKKFNTDNATMIAVAAYIQYLRKKNRSIRAQANLNL